nr:MAG TPA: hypothetical protein [Caudoviricetes sp.]
MYRLFSLREVRVRRYTLKEHSPIGVIDSRSFYESKRF